MVFVVIFFLVVWRGDRNLDVERRGVGSVWLFGLFFIRMGLGFLDVCFGYSWVLRDYVYVSSDFLEFKLEVLRERFFYVWDIYRVFGRKSSNNDYY